MSGRILLYKYLKKNHALDLVQNGNIRIGTFEEYRNIEDSERGDKKEGTLSRYTKLDKPLVIRNPSDLKGAFKELIHFEGYGEGNGKLIINSKQGSINTKVPNAYLYCLTKEYSLSIMKEFKADCIIHISDPYKFFSLIHLKLQGIKEKPANSVADSCNYIGHEFNYESSKQNIFFLKDKRFRHQEEYRMVSTYLKPFKNYNPIILSIPEITSCVKIIYPKS